MVFLDDPKGSPFYKQVRIGRHGKPFNMYKFRSMYAVSYTHLDVYKRQDIGVLKYIDRAAGVVCVKFGDKTAMYTGSELDDLDKAFAVTVHKSQGSEYDYVIIPTVGIPPQLMFRNLLYTGVTRAKKLLVLVGTEQMVTRICLLYTSRCV